LAVVLLAIGSTVWGGGTERGDTKTTDVATQLFGPFVLPFEVVGVLLLAAVIGGVFLAKRDRSTTDRPE
jgi:NADH:ubiquinone oxidoreductase subunit 6 (subunit J)